MTHRSFDEISELTLPQIKLLSSQGNIQLKRPYEYPDILFAGPRKHGTIEGAMSFLQAQQDAWENIKAPSC